MRFKLKSSQSWAVALLIASSLAETALAAPPPPLLQTWADAARKRDVPVKIYLPAQGDAPAPVILFSHGLGASRQTYSYLGTYWADHGYVAVHLQHPGSDDQVWRNATGNRAGAMIAAASVANYLLRVQDVSFAIDELTRLNADKASPLFGRLNLDEIGIAGHSFGALTAQAEAGQTVLDGAIEKIFRDNRIKAAVALSPSPPPRANKAVAAFAKMAVPIFYFTGTADFEPLTMAGVTQRRQPFDDGGGSDQYLTIFNGGDHMLFVGRSITFATKTGGPMLAYVQKATTQFFDAYLRKDPTSLAWLKEKAAVEVRPIGKFESKNSEAEKN